LQAEKGILHDFMEMKKARTFTNRSPFVSSCDHYRQTLADAGCLILADLGVSTALNTRFSESYDREEYSVRHTGWLDYKGDGSVDIAKAKTKLSNLERCAK
jgi:hypothetical protein